MTSSHPSPWSDPATETEPGAPYAGPPPTTMPYWTPAAPHAVPWPQPWPQPWPPAPARPQRPGQVIAAAVLAFVQAAGVALATAYLQLLGAVFSMAAGEPGFPADGAALAAEAGVLSLVQLASVVLLLTAGVLGLASRRPVARWTLVAAFSLQLSLAAYWAARLLAVLDQGAGVLAALVLGFAAAPAVALGLAVGRPARAWFRSSPDEGTAPHR
ncbi:hypothetical protein SAMN05660642_02373 [Geodermatophilus siccatus]|uniref:Uncharacterized protein n=2 Tax=Geodermatophilus siccatus TaxID=1137991 RepID=A0A1G9SUA0_9ACTN|nr:hypothetical protein SAMN05660642_02373 [Geodermatophilus siccatus]